MQVGVFVDVGNQFFCVSKKWPGRKINYEAYLNKAIGEDELYRAFAYGTQLEEGAAISFIDCLRHLNFDVKYKTVERNTWYTWDAGITVDVLRLSDKLDVVVLGSSSRSMVPLVKVLRDKGIKVIILACGINRELKEACDKWIEIREDLLEEANETSEAA